jgi:hypothetical protein
MVGIAWDHANSEVKMSFRSEENYVIITLQNSVEFEGEMKGVGVANASLNPYRKAFLDTLAYAEGTANYPNNGYTTMFT